MQPIHRLLRYWPTLLSSSAALGALVLLMRVRESPLHPAPFVRIDALSAFFSFATLAGLALSSQHQDTARVDWRIPVLTVLLLLAYTTTLTPIIAGAFLLVALAYQMRGTSAAAEPAASGPYRRLRVVGGRLRSAGGSMPGPLAAGCLSIGYGALALRGALRYDDRSAGSALDAFVFWFVLLATAIACSRLFGQPTNDQRPTTKGETGDKRQETRDNLQSAIYNLQSAISTTDIFRIGWLYPLARLYSLGPWNAGWSFATMLLGGTMALWWAGASFARPQARAQAVPMPLSYLALALAGLGLSSGAGVAAGCYAILAYLVILVGEGDRAVGREGDRAHSPSPLNPLTSSPLHWLLSGAVPLTAPFVATWMLVGSALAGGVALLSGAAWLVALLYALACALRSDPTPTIARRALLVAALASVALGVGAPLVVRTLIEPVIEQLQGGLTPYGDVNIWPWVGLAASDSAHTQVTTVPSIAVALLMLVLSALVYLVFRLRATGTADFVSHEARSASDAVALVDTQGKLAALMRDLCREVPWLGALFGAGAQGEERRIDGE